MKSIWLMYHDIYLKAPDAQIPRTAAMYHISRDAFSQHLAIIEEAGIPVATVGETKSDSIGITFDDGWAGAFELALPLISQKGWKATYFITRDFVERVGFCDKDMIAEASRQGMEIGVHGTTHRVLSACSREEIIYEWSACKDFLETLTGKQVKYASLPGGDINNEIIACARECGLEGISTSIPGIQKDNSYLIKRIPVRDNTSQIEIRRYCNFKVMPEVARFTLFQIPKRLIGMRNYTRLRRFFMDSSAKEQREVFKP